MNAISGVVVVGIALAVVAGGCGGDGRDRDRPDAAIPPGRVSGTLDEKFGNGGLVTSGLEGRDLGRAVTPQRVGAGESLLVGGKAGPSGNTDFLLMRYDAAGQLDTTFGPATATPRGVVKVGFALGSADEGKSLAIAPDGHIAYAGIVTVGNDGRFGIAWLDAGGGLDQGFDDDGLASVNFGPGNDEGKSVALQPCGPATCIVIAGKAEAADRQGDLALAIVDDHGALVRSVTTDLRGPNDELNDVVVLADGRIVAAGETGDASGSAIVVVRYTAAGDLDLTFGASDGNGGRTGAAITRVNSDAHAYALTVDPSGRIIAVGRTSGVDGDDLVVARYTATGEPDRTFDGDGVRVIIHDGAGEIGTGVAVDVEGRVTIAGRSTTANGSGFVLVRLTDDGRDDDSFGAAGTAIFAPAVPASADSDDGAYGLTVQVDGKLVVIGELRGADDDLAIVRVHP